MPRHPPYQRMIYFAITSLKDINGSSCNDIHKYINSLWPSCLETSIDRCLKNMVAKELLIQNGKFFRLAPLKPQAKRVKILPAVVTLLH